MFPLIIYTDNFYLYKLLPKLNTIISLVISSDKYYLLFHSHNFSLYQVTSFNICRIECVYKYMYILYSVRESATNFQFFNPEFFN